MFALRLLLAFLASAVLGFSAVELTEGITRAELEGLVGKPISILQKGDKTVLVYPRKGRAEFVGNRLVYFERIEVLNTPETAPAAPASTAAPSTPVVHPAAASLPVPALPASKAAPANAPTPSKAAPIATAAVPAATPAKATVPPSTPLQPGATVDVVPPVRDTGPALREDDDEPPVKVTEEERLRRAKHDAEVAAMQERFLNGEAIAPPKEAPQSSNNPWVVMLLGALFKIPVTVLVLKMAFKWCDIDADWSQMWLPALADTITRTIIQAAAEAVWGLDNLFYVDECISFFVLLFVLIKTTHACTAVRAIGVAFAAKLASIVVWTVLSVFILGFLFSRAHS